MIPLQGIGGCDVVLGVVEVGEPAPSGHGDRDLLRDPGALSVTREDDRSRRRDIGRLARPTSLRLLQQPERFVGSSQVIEHQRMLIFPPGHPLELHECGVKLLLVPVHPGDPLTASRNSWSALSKSPMCR